MAGIIRTVVRVGVIGTLAAGGVAVIVSASPRARALLSQVQTNVNEAIDSQIDDPVALRAKLRDLVAQNPKRVAEVRADLSEVDEQIAEFERELAISNRVVELAQGDLDTLDALLKQAGQARTRHASFDGQPTVIRIRFNDRSLSLDEAYARAAQITNQRDAYTKRAANIRNNLGYLAKQRTQLEQVMTKLESEQSQLQSELWLLERDLDTIARNDRLLEMMKRRQETIDRNARYVGTSIEGYKTQVARIKGEQARRMESLQRGSLEENYVNRAQMELDRNRAARSLYTPDEGGTIQIEPRVLELTPDQDPNQQDTGPTPNPIASRD